MKKRNYKYLIRKTHRYLGIFIGVQFLLWTLGGLYFSWTKINEIRGEHLRKERFAINTNRDFIAPQAVFEQIKQNAAEAEITKFQLIEILGEPFYEVQYKSANEKSRTRVVNVGDGTIRPPISETEAGKIALDSLKNPLAVRQIAYLTPENVGGHHEYREKPLPAWAVTFEDDLTIYLSAETGQIGAFRTNKWRVFDFLWMLHTMDFAKRDNINNYLLRGFSLLGIFTILSGFLLFFVSSKLFRKPFFKKRAN